MTSGEPTGTNLSERRSTHPNPRMVPVHGSVSAARSSRLPRPSRPLRRLGRTVIHPTPPYSYRGSFVKPSHFRTTDRLEQGLACWQTLRVGRRVFGLRFSGNDDLWRPEIEVSVYGRGTLTRIQWVHLINLLRRRFDTQSDLTPFVRLARRTPRGRRSLLRWIGSRPTCAYSLYELLVILICLQNAQVGRTARMMQRLFEAYGSLVRFDGRSLWAFWEPRALVGQECHLRELRVGYRARSLERLSRYLARGDRTFEDRLWELSDAELAAALREIPGVGPATVGGLMLDYFHRYDALAYLPPWDTKVFRRLLKQPDGSSADLVALVHRTWPGYSMLALHLLFEDQFWRMREGRPNVLTGLARPQ